MAALSKADYLKKYMSGPDAEDKKKKKRKKLKHPLAKVTKLQIIDDDIDLAMLPSSTSEAVEEEEDEEPVVADIVDDRPEHVKVMETYRQDKRWKTVDSKDDDRLQNTNLERRQKHDSDSDSPSSRQNRHDSDSDQSPLRSKRHNSDSDQSPPRRKRQDSDSDQSPPRRKRQDSYSDQSPPRRKRHDSDSDQSPPRRKRQDSDSDQSPPRRKRQDSDSDQSPPRRNRQDSDSDQSPPRRKRHNSDSDQSPPRKNRHGSEKSPPRKLHKKSDLNSSSGHSHIGKKQTDDKMNKTLGGAKAGLSSAREMREEAIKLKKKQDKFFDKIDEKTLGRNARTVFRDKKSGRKRDLAAEGEEEAAKNKKLAELQAKYKKWGQGLAQIEQQVARVDDAVQEAAKPLARYADDNDMDAMLRNQEREGDPMLAFLSKKKQSKSNKKELPKYRGPEPPPNRYGLRPGYRWDGVDRSNGFEAKLFKTQASRKAVVEEAYKWSVEDM